MSDTTHCLRWSGQKDTAMLRAAMERCKQVPMFEAADPKMVTHEEYTALIEEGKVSKAESYWCVKEGLIGLITVKGIGSPNQWEQVSHCKVDFIEGWEQALRS